MTTTTPDARGLIERARSVAVGMRIRGERVPADLLEDLAAALEAATTPPPAATGDDELLAELQEAAGSVALYRLAGVAATVLQAARVLRQRGEELAAERGLGAQKDRMIRDICAPLREYVDRHHLGLGGERLHYLVLEDAKRLREALSAATARAEEAEADLLSHLSTGRCVLIYSQKDLDAATDAKREACAKVCDGIAEKCEFVDSEASAEYISGARDCAAAIRARQAGGEEKK